MKRKKKMNKRERLLRELGKYDASTDYIDCPVCGESKRCHREVTRMDDGPEGAREILTCRYCGYIRDSNFPKNGTAKIEEPDVLGIYYIEYKKARDRLLAAEFGHIFEKVTQKDISWFKKVLEDPSVDKHKSFFKLTWPRKLGSKDIRVKSKNDKGKRLN